MSKKKKCCLCNETYNGYGNNPAPLSDNETDRCCDDCNLTKVLPARLGMLPMPKRQKEKLAKLFEQLSKK